jgi:hypothetical protein
MIGYYHMSNKGIQNNADFTLGHDTLTEIVNPSDINLNSFNIKDVLHQNFWDVDKLKPIVRTQILKIVDDFYEGIEIDGVVIEDVIFTGSLAGYNWSKYSDVDIHIVVDYDKIKIPNETLVDYFEMKKKLFSIKYEDLNFYGYPIEMYVEDVKQELTVGSPRYSVENDSWVKLPVKKDMTNTMGYIKMESSRYINKIDSLVNNFDNVPEHMLEHYLNKIDRVYNEIKDGRGREIKKGGEFTPFNIIFKILRRTNRIGNLIKLKSDIYEKLNSLK